MQHEGSTVHNEKARYERSDRGLRAGQRYRMGCSETCEIP